MGIGRNGGGKDEEAEEGHDQDIVHPEQQFAVRRRDRRQHNGHGIGPEGGPGHDHRDDQDEQRQVKNPPASSGRLPGILPARRADLLPRIFPVQEEDEADEQQGGGGAQGKHVQHEMSRADVCLPVQEQVLRAAEGRQQGSADGGNILHGDHGQDVLFLLPAPEQQDCQRHEDDQRHVVGDEHGREKHPEHQEQGQGGHPLHPGSQAHHRLQHVLAFEAFQDAQHHQQGPQGPPVDVPDQLRGGRCHDQGDRRCQYGQGQHKFLLQKLNDFLHFQRSFRPAFRGQRKV